MTAIKSIAFCAGWIITASIGLWAMALYGVIVGIMTYVKREVELKRDGLLTEKEK